MKTAMMILAAFATFAAIAEEPVWPEDFASKVAAREEAWLSSVGAVKTAVTAMDSGSLVADISYSQNCGTEVQPFETRGVNFAFCLNQIAFSSMPVGFFLIFK
jgi:hypothetical protein